MILIVGLGVEPGDLTQRAAEALLSGTPVLLRTGRHPAAAFLKGKGVPFTTLDELYEQSQDYDELLSRIAERVCMSAPCVFGVPGGAGLMDESVRAVVSLAKERGLPCEVAAGVGYCERAGAAAGGLSCAVCMAAADYGPGAYDPRLPLVLQELHSPLTASEAKLRLLEVYPAEHVALLNGRPLPLEELDRQEAAAYDHRTCLVVPPVPLNSLERFDLESLRRMLEKLRDPLDGSAWDREQTHESLRGDLLEESYEAVDAIDRGDMDDLCEELGDMLLHIGMQAQIASEHGDFDLRDVVSGICLKLLRRLPQVFSGAPLKTAEEVQAEWDKTKKQAKGQSGQAEAMRELPRALPALLRADKAQRLASPLGYDFKDASAAMEKLLEEAAEVRSAAPEELEGELGDLLFSCVNVCRLCGVNAEAALGRSLDKFIRRIGAVEEAAGKRGIDLKSLSEAQLDLLWEEAKAALNRV